jgi:hypothetical protein
VILFAHAGHVIVDLLYAAPLLVMVGLLVVGKWRERRQSGDETAVDDP